MEQKETKQEATKKNNSGNKNLLKSVLFIGVIFLLIAGWIALLLAPPFGTALAILILFFILAII